MHSKIQRFQIKGLHGYRNFNIDFDNNTLIMVGENGTGKTTVLRLLYYLLSAQWSSLAQYKFSSLIITINGKDYRIQYPPLEKIDAKKSRSILRRLPPDIRSDLREFLDVSEGRFTLTELELFCEKHDIPFRFMLSEFDLGDLLHESQTAFLKKTLSDISNSLDSQILYLPTYRRIEQELSLIFKGIDVDELPRIRHHIPSRDKSKSFVELIEFGMKDVEGAIDKSLGKLKDFDRENLNNLTLGYLGDVVDKKYEEVKIEEIHSASEGTIRSVLERIPESILSEEHKYHLFERINKVRETGVLDEHARVICHYFLKLLHSQEELRNKESHITNFCDVCNQYMKDKRFVYTSSDFTLTIMAKDDKGKEQKIEPRHLSSGEKQIVSLFSHLYLSGEENYFVLIDEPELSLSVPWQMRFLTDIKNGGFCSGLIAATHSPFIYDNELKPYAHSLGEFVT